MDSGLFIALRLVREDAGIITEFVRTHGLRPLSEEDLHLTVARRSRGTFDLSTVDTNTDQFNVDVHEVPYGSFTMSNKGIRQAVYVRLNATSEIRGFRRRLLESIGSPFVTPSGGLKEIHRDWMPHVTLSLQRALTLTKNAFPLTTIRFEGLMASPRDPYWHTTRI